MRKVGIMGGTFDPIHIGHLILAENALTQLELEEVVFLPNGNPPHKRGHADRARELQRLEMTRLAILDDEKFTLDDREICPQDGPGRKDSDPVYHYTKDTMRQLKEEHPDTEYYFLIGADSLMTFHEWVEPETISRYCILAAAVRDGESMEDLRRQADLLRQNLGTRTVFIDIPEVAVSSTELRKRCSEGRSVRYLVPETVERYILENGLYQNTGVSGSAGASQDA